MTSNKNYPRKSNRTKFAIFNSYYDFNIGRNDLDPLGGRFGSGGGMLFNPPGLRNPHGPPPGIPGTMPGARFDPFNPPDVERQRRNSRDFDHFRPPGGPGSGFYDDMFM